MHQIGVGVLGPVFRAYPPDGNHLVALKAFHLDLTPEQASALADALNEIVAVGLSHRSVVSALGAGVSDGVPYLAFEYVAAESLDVAVRHYAPAPVDTALPFVVQLAEAVDAAHEQGFSHGALHLRDIFVRPDLARVGGFGVVPALERLGQRGPLRRPYAAPEQIAGTDWGPPADRFALAAVAYELLTGKRASAAGRHVTDRLRQVSSAGDAQRLARLFTAALAPEPDARPRSAALFADQLADAVGWTGADAVRRALVEVNEAGDDPEPEQSDGAPMVAAAGGAVPQLTGTGPAGTGGGAMSRRKKRARKHQPEPQLDWTERALDRGLPEELRQPAAYEPRPVGAPPGFERPEDRGAAPVPDFARLDALVGGVDHAVGDEGILDDDDLDTTTATRNLAESSMRPGSRGPRPTTPEGGSPSGLPGLGPEPRAASGSLLDQLDEPDRVSDPRLPHESGASVAGPDAGLFDAPDNAVPTPDPDNGAAPEIGSEGDEVDLAVIQARYRPDDDGSTAEGEADEGHTERIYEPILLSDLPDRLGDDRSPGDAVHDRLDGAESDDELAGPAPLESAALDEDEDEDDRTFALLPDGEYDYEPDEDDTHDLTDVLIESRVPGRGRRLPLALVAAVIGVTAFVIGFGWMAGDDGTAPDGPVPAESTAAGGVPGQADPARSEEGVAPPGREFSEASVAGSLGDEAPVETPDVAPVEPPVEEPPRPAPPARPTPVVARQPGVAPTTGASSDPEPVPPTPDGRLLVRSVPPGAAVTVNGEPRGVTPLALSDLPYGDYDLRVILDGYNAREHRLAISSEEPIVSISSQLGRVVEPQTARGVGSIFVDTRPRGVNVWLDQRLVGETPMLIPDVAAGAHDVEFRLDGYRNWTTTVQVGPSEQARVTASLDHARR